MLTLHYPSSFSAADRGSWQSRAVTIAVIVALHLAASYALLQIEGVRAQLAEMAPIMVSLIAPPRIDVAPPKPAPQKPKPVDKRQPMPVQTAPVVTAPATAASNAVPAPAPESTKPQDSGTPTAGTVAATPPPAIVPPRFDAAYLRNPAPVYPAHSRRTNEQGRVVLRVLVSADGEAEQVELRTSSGSSLLDDAALQTVKKWKFTPARQGSLPLAAWVLVPIAFRLER